MGIQFVKMEITQVTWSLLVVPRGMVDNFPFSRSPSIYR